MRESQSVARREDVVVERREVIGGDPDLVPELPRESGARQDRGRKADGGLPNVEELEGARREVEAHQLLQELPRLRARDREAAEGRGRRAQEDIGRRVGRSEE